MVEPIKTKICTNCNHIKPITKFHKQKNGKYGLKGRCKQCQKQYDKQYHQNHKAIRQQSDKQRYQNHKAEIQQYNKQYYKTLSGHIRHIWRSMLYRCNNPKNRAYKNYGGRGIKVKFACFNDFFNYIVKELKADPRGLTIDRIDNDGHYERGNIRFVNQAENNRNRRINFIHH